MWLCSPADVYVYVDTLDGAGGGSGSNSDAGDSSGGVAVMMPLVVVGDTKKMYRVTRLRHWTEVRLARSESTDYRSDVIRTVCVLVAVLPCTTCCCCQSHYRSTRSTTTSSLFCVCASLPSLRVHVAATFASCKQRGAGLPLPASPHLYRSAQR